MARQMIEVLLSERFSSQRVMPRNAIFTRMTRLTRTCFRSCQLVTISQKKNIPLTRHKTPNMFLLVDTPVYS